MTEKYDKQKLADAICSAEAFFDGVDTSFEWLVNKDHLLALVDESISHREAIFSCAPEEEIDKLTTRAYNAACTAWRVRTYAMLLWAAMLSECPMLYDRYVEAIEACINEDAKWRSKGQMKIEYLQCLAPRDATLYKFN